MFCSFTQPPVSDSYDPNLFAIFNKSKTMDCAIYWFCNENNCMSQFDPKLNKTYFDPSKQSILFIPGWQPNQLELSQRETFDYLHNIYGYRRYDYDEKNFPKKQSHYLHPNILSLGKSYNIGIFYWDQFGDEPNVLSLPSKIWTPHTSPRSIRYKYYDKKSPQKTGISLYTVRELFLTCYLQIFSKTPPLLVAHSTGVQVLCSFMELIASPPKGFETFYKKNYNSMCKFLQIPKPSSNTFSGKRKLTVPTNLTLLDPFYVNFSSYASLSHKVLSSVPNLSLSYYLTSELSDNSNLVCCDVLSDNNTKLKELAQTITITPTIFNSVGFRDKSRARHLSAIWIFFSTFDHNVPFGLRQPPRDIQKYMNTTKSWKQKNNWYNNICGSYLEPNLTIADYEYVFS